MIENKSVISNSEDTAMQEIYEYIKHIKKIIKNNEDRKDELALFEEKVKKAFETCQSIIEKDTVLYKSRIYDESDKYEKTTNINSSNKFKAYLLQDSFVNPNVPENRMNKKGTKCLYVASDIPTSILEIVASNNDYVSVSEIRCKEDLYIVDLSKYWGYGDTREESLFSLQIQNSANLDDKDVGYLFPQYIAKICKDMGFDGIGYASKYVDMNVPVMKHMGINYAIFNYDKCEVISSDFYQVSDRSMSLYRLSGKKTSRVEL